MVASEVKDLAQATSKATEDISNRIQAIQGDTGAAAAARSTSSGVTEANWAAADLAQMSTELQQIVSQFRV